MGAAGASETSKAGELDNREHRHPAQISQGTFRPVGEILIPILTRLIRGRS